jgi:hypothetical protein
VHQALYAQDQRKGRGRFVQTSFREWAYARAYYSSEQRAAELPLRLHRYNWHRPHGGIGSKPPISRLDRLRIPAQLAFGGDEHFRDHADGRTRAMQPAHDAACGVSKRIRTVGYLLKSLNELDSFSYFAPEMN